MIKPISNHSDGSGIPLKAVHSKTKTEDEHPEVCATGAWATTSHCFLRWSGKALLPQEGNDPAVVCFVWSPKDSIIKKSSKIFQLFLLFGSKRVFLILCLEVLCSFLVVSTFWLRFATFWVRLYWPGVVLDWFLFSPWSTSNLLPESHRFHSFSFKVSQQRPYKASQPAI